MKSRTLACSRHWLFTTTMRNFWLDEFYATHQSSNFYVEDEIKIRFSKYRSPKIGPMGRISVYQFREICSTLHIMTKYYQEFKKALNFIEMTKHSCDFCVCVCESDPGHQSRTERSQFRLHLRRSFLRTPMFNPLQTPQDVTLIRPHRHTVTILTLGKG
jgi:hypothetical protein